MSENQQPSSEEQAAPPDETAAAENGMPAAGADGSAVPVQDEEQMPDIDPADVRIFGMPRVCFHGAAFGVAGGYIACGLIELLAEQTAGTPIGALVAKVPGAAVCSVIGAAIGYLIGRQLHKKRLAAQKAAEAADDTPEP